MKSSVTFLSFLFIASLLFISMLLRSSNIMAFAQNTPPQTAPRPPSQSEIKIGIVKRKDLPHECGCSLWIPKDYVRSNIENKRKVVFFSELNDYAIMNIGGKDVGLKFVEESPPPQKEKVGQRMWQKLKAEHIEVRIDYVATKVCGELDDSCEATYYKATITAKRGNQKDVLHVKGFCGC